ncbi:MAG: PQQ-binding-like beta-propeller repeat protein, partial [Vicinamibacterales bacterium]
MNSPLSWLLLMSLAAGGVWAAADAPPFTPVSDSILRNPGPSDWLHWRRTYESWGYSPLTQINRQNVSRLQLAWAWTMEQGSQQPTPLVSNGVMYLPHAGNVVHALNAATGDVLWEYRYRSPGAPERTATAPPDGAPGVGGGRGPGRGAATAGDPNARPVRSLAIAADKVFMTTPDAGVVALNARTGLL